VRLTDHAGPPVAVGGRAAQIGRLPLLLADRLGADHELHRRPQVRLTDLDNVVAFLAENGRGGVAGRADVHQDHPDAEILHLGDHLGEVFLRAHHQCVADRPVAGQGGQVPVDLALHPLAVTGPRPAEPQLDTGEVGEGVVLGAAAAFFRGLIPVAAQQRQAGAIARHVLEHLEHTRVVPGNGLSVACAVNGHRAIF
jgi:hypothetical protein